MADKMKKATYRMVSARNTPVDQRTALFPGEIRIYTSADTRPSVNWLLCDGAGDGSTPFNLPDFRGRFSVVLVIRVTDQILIPLWDRN